MAVLLFKSQCTVLVHVQGNAVGAFLQQQKVPANKLPEEKIKMKQEGSFFPLIIKAHPL